MTDERKLIICLGPSSVGRRLLSETLRALGWTPLLFEDDETARARVARNIHDRNYPLQGLERFNAVIGQPMDMHYQGVIEQAARPQDISTILLGHNPHEAGWEQAIAAVEANRGRSRKELLARNWSYLHAVRYAEDLYDDVINYFVDNPSLRFMMLEMGGDFHWEPVCNFLEVPAPDGPPPA